MSRGSDSITSSTRTFQATTKKEEPKKPKKNLNLKLPKIGLRLPWLIVGLLLIFSLFMLQQYHEAKQKLEIKTPAAAVRQNNSLIAKVGKLIILPKDETPIIVNVPDAAKVRSQEFYAIAKNGDVVLIYKKEQQAILYRPSANIIVNVAHVTISGNQ